MHNYQILVEYDGTKFVGWQIQKNGLSIQEVLQKAIQKIKPYGVDVSSGVEQSHGVKKLSKMKAFIEGARSV